MKYLPFQFKPYSLESNVNSLFDFEKITQLLIMGHGLESDLELFKELFKKLPNLSEVLLFVYEGESENEINRKKRQITEFTSKDVLVERY